MIEVRVADLARLEGEALLRPVAADGSAVNTSARRLELAAGPDLVDRWRQLGELPVGSAAITPAGLLPVDYVVHAVVRSTDEPASSSSVRLALTNALRRLTEWGIAQVNVAPLGTGAGNLDVEEAAAVMIPLILDHCRAPSSPLHVVLVVDSDYERDVFERELRRHDLTRRDAAGA